MRIDTHYYYLVVWHFSSATNKLRFTTLFFFLGLETLVPRLSSSWSSSLNDREGLDRGEKLFLKNKNVHQRHSIKRCENVHPFGLWFGRQTYYEECYGERQTYHGLTGDVAISWPLSSGGSLVLWSDDSCSSADLHIFLRSFWDSRVLPDSGLEKTKRSIHYVYSSLANCIDICSKLFFLVLVQAFFYFFNFPTFCLLSLVSQAVLSFPVVPW